MELRLGVDQNLVDDEDEAAEEGAGHEAASGRLRPVAMFEANQQLKQDRHGDREDDVGNLALAKHPAAQRAEQSRRNGGEQDANRPRPRRPEMRQPRVLGFPLGRVVAGLVSRLQDSSPGIRRFHRTESYTQQRPPRCTSLIAVAYWSSAKRVVGRATPPHRWDSRPHYRKAFACPTTNLTWPVAARSARSTRAMTRRVTRLTSGACLRPRRRR